MFKDLLKLNRELAKSEEPRPFYAAVVVIDKERSKILLGKRREDGIWTSPAGAANVGEHPKQAAIREAFEEANLQIKPRDLKELPSMVVGNGKVCHVFLAYVDSKACKVHTGNDPDKEVVRWEWLSLQEPLPGKIDKNRLTSINNAKMKLFGLRKSILENPEAGIDLNTAEQSQDEMGSAGNRWVDVIVATMAGADYGETPRELMLPNHLRLYISKVDDGIYSGIVRKEDSMAGDNGEVQTQLMKMTPEAMVQALKAKGYLPRDKSEPKPAQAELPKDYAGLYAALKDYEGELHIHLHKSKQEALDELALSLQLNLL
jgi:8-oxo-dGTP pyrophosphatase MutT (NUDIX family)